MKSQQQQWFWSLPSAILIIIGVTTVITNLYHIQPQEMNIQHGLTSTGVVSGTSLRMMMHLLWFGRTFSPFSSTCTMGEAEKDRKAQLNAKNEQQTLKLWPGFFFLFCFFYLVAPQVSGPYQKSAV